MVLDPETARFCRRLFESRGLQVVRYRPAVLARRKPACLRAMGVASVAEAASALDRDDLVERDDMYAALGDLVLTLAATGPADCALRQDVLTPMLEDGTPARTSGAARWRRPTSGS